jgi:nucleotide-binding universal stress UspA family protein
MFEKVLFPTDFSDYAKKTLDCIAGFPGAKDVILLHVVKETQYPKGAGIADTLAVKNARRYLDEAKEYLTSLNPSIRVTLDTVVSPDIPGAILDAAEKWNAGLIVIGAHGKSVKAGVLLGSVPSTVLCRIRFTRWNWIRSLSRPR